MVNSFEAGNSVRGDDSYYSYMGYLEAPLVVEVPIDYNLVLSPS